MHVNNTKVYKESCKRVSNVVIIAKEDEDMRKIWGKKDKLCEELCEG